MTSAAIVAHQGGWDETLLVLGPIAVIALLLRIAKRRVTRSQQSPDRSTHPGR